MKNRFLSSVIFILSITTGCAHLSAKSEQIKPYKENTEFSETVHNIANIVANYHYNKSGFNDVRSSMIHDNLLKTLDANKMLFTQEQIDLFEKYRFSWDNALLTGDLYAAFGMHKAFTNALEEYFNFADTLVQNIEDLDFTTDEYFIVDRENMSWAANEEELQYLWTMRVKDEVLRMKLSTTSIEDIKNTLSRRYTNQNKRLQQIRPEDIFSTYINAALQTLDPHTAYLSPQNAENFEINMRLKLTGIGATLSSDADYTTVMSLVPAGPAQRSGLISVNDKIVGVAQDKGDIVDIRGWRVDEVVKLIRGEKNTRVRLEIIPSTNIATDLRTKIVTIVREEIKLEEQAAKKDILYINKDDRQFKIGAIQIPAFYMDFEAYNSGDKNYRSVTRDVKNLLEILQKENVDALIIDLRGNGGGALHEATNLTNLFLGAGSVVQVRSANDRINILGDNDAPKPVFNKPIAVLVDRLSASASEIFAAAMQDYGVAIITGSQTFGKGTVQSVQKLNHGEIKLTVAKFYRISGGSTQNRGVIPDILFPELRDIAQIGEGSQDYSLSFDEITPVYSNSKRTHIDKSAINFLEHKHIDRIQSNPEFTYNSELIGVLKELSLIKSVPLNETKRKEFQDYLDNKQLVVENKLRSSQGKILISSIKDKEVIEINKRQLKDDIYIQETANILIDKIMLDKKISVVHSSY